MALPIVVFGAFDRHNLGDMLFAHVAQAMLADCECLFAGLAERDLRAWGGHRVRALATLLRERAHAPCILLHAGGEILDCSAWEAAVMLLEPEEAQHVIARLDSDPRKRARWARRILQTTSLAPYAASGASLPGVACTAFNAVGGVALDRCAPALRAEVRGALQRARHVGVRDAVTQSQLRRWGIECELVPDSAVMVAERLGNRIRRHSARGEVRRVRAMFAGGYLACQFSADFGDDATLDTIGAQLDRVSAATGMGTALFRAGAAPWHDDLDVLQRIAERMRTHVVVFRSLEIHDICGLIASSRGFCGSSLHGRIVATAFGVPRVSVRAPAPHHAGARQAAWAASWEIEGMPGVVGSSEIADAIRPALHFDAQSLERHASELAQASREGFATLRAALDAVPRSDAW